MSCRDKHSYKVLTNLHNAELRRKTMGKINPKDYPDRDSFYDACWAAMSPEEQAQYVSGSSTRGAQSEMANKPLPTLMQFRVVAEVTITPA